MSDKELKLQKELQKNLFGKKKYFIRFMAFLAERSLLRKILWGIGLKKFVWSLSNYTACFDYIYEKL